MVLNTVIFDIGGVILSWEPARAFEPVMPVTEVAAFLERIGFAEWNAANDALANLAESEEELVRRHPADENGIRGYRRHFARSVTGMIDQTPAVIAELAINGIRLGALTNWAEELFLLTRERFGVLDRFADIVVSGTERLVKPDPAIFRLACERLGVEPSQAVFVDDSPVNTDAACELGLTGLLFTSAQQLRADLVDLGLLGAPTRVEEPIHHLALRKDWEAASASGDYPWATRDVDYAGAGFVHCAFADQVADVRREFFAEFGEDDLVLLQLDPSDLPVVVESGYPHLFAPFPVERAQLLS